MSTLTANVVSGPAYGTAPAYIPSPYQNIAAPTTLMPGVLSTPVGSTTCNYVSFCRSYHGLAFLLYVLALVAVIVMVWLSNNGTMSLFSAAVGVTVVIGVVILLMFVHWFWFLRGVIPECADTGFSLGASVQAGVTQQVVAAPVRYVAPEPVTTEVVQATYTVAPRPVTQIIPGYTTTVPLTVRRTDSAVITDTSTTSVQPLASVSQQTTVTSAATPVLGPVVDTTLVTPAVVVAQGPALGTVGLGVGTVAVPGVAIQNVQPPGLVVGDGTTTGLVVNGAQPLPYQSAAAGNAGGYWVRRSGGGYTVPKPVYAAHPGRPAYF